MAPALLRNIGIWEAISRESRVCLVGGEDITLLWTVLKHNVHNLYTYLLAFIGSSKEPFWSRPDISDNMLPVYYQSFTFFYVVASKIDVH